MLNIYAFKKLKKVLSSMNNLRLLHKVGEGAHGVVYKAYNESSNLIVAIKKVNFKSSNGSIPIRLLRFF